MAVLLSNIDQTWIFSIAELDVSLTVHHELTIY